MFRKKMLLLSSGLSMDAVFFSEMLVLTNPHYATTWKTIVNKCIHVICYFISFMNYSLITMNTALLNMATLSCACRNLHSGGRLVEQTCDCD